MHLHILGVIGFESAIVGLMETDQDRHDLTCRQLAFADPLSTAILQLFPVPDWEIDFAEIIDIAEYFI